MPAPPAAHANQREPKTTPTRKVQVNDSIPQLCWYFQTYWHHRTCTDYTDPARGCKYTHRECLTINEYRALLVPPEVQKAQKENQKKASAMGVEAPTRPPSAKPDWPKKDSWQSGDASPRWASLAKGKGDKGKGQGKGKGKGKGKKGKKGGKRKGAACWGEDDWYGEWDESNYQLQANGEWVAKDWENGWMGEDGYTWINPSPVQAGNQGAAQPASLSMVREAPPGAGSTLVRQSGRSTRNATATQAPTVNTVIDNDGNFIPLSDNAEFQWGVKT